MIHFDIKRILNGAGILLAAGGFMFVVSHLRDYGAQINFTRFNGAIWLRIGVLALPYGLANLMLAFAWWNLLAHFGSQTSCLWALKTYGISQIAKYIPGNIFHLAGRQAMGMAEGLSGWALAKSSIWELGLVSVAGSTFGALALPLVVPTFTGSLASGAFIALVCLTGLGTWFFVGIRVGWAFFNYMGYLTISGMLFLALAGIMSGDWGSLPWMGVASAYVVAWLCGLLTPGAPAGVGVREMVLLFLLKGVIAPEDLLLSIVLGRLVTMAGDAVFWLISILCSHLIKIG